MIQIGWLLEPAQGELLIGTPWPGQGTSTLADPCLAEHPPTGAGRAPRGEAPRAPTMPARPHRSLGRAVAPLCPHACDGREPLWRHTTSCHAGRLGSARPAPPLWGPALSHLARRSSAGDGAGRPPGTAGGSTGKDTVPPSPQRALFGACAAIQPAKGCPCPAQPRHGTVPEPPLPSQPGG